MGKSVMAIQGFKGQSKQLQDCRSFGMTTQKGIGLSAHSLQLGQVFRVTRWRLTTMISGVPNFNRPPICKRIPRSTLDVEASDGIR
jgi:hypothetical protein